MCNISSLDFSKIMRYSMGRGEFSFSGP